ncbi:hypothetical protein ACFU53_33675 [Streptomyces sp. NPDC057474]|uniref:hypothetical protein n=1 Tax=Streptomyces sp. NPDC057474 TaxID=3346144 RepID=UPI0036B66AB3
MRPLRHELASALHELRTTMPGGHLVDHWGGPPATPKDRVKEAAHLDTWTEVLEQALARSRFERIRMPEGRCPPDGEFLLAWAMHRTGAPLAQFPDLTSRSGDDIVLGTGYDEIVVFRGPLEIEGHAQLNGTVVVLGDLTLHGGLVDGSSAESALVVVGNERVRALDAHTDHLVTGDLDAELLLVRSEEADLQIGGRCTTRVTLSQYWEVGDAGEQMMVREFGGDLARVLHGWLHPVPAPGPLTVDDVFRGAATGRWQVARRPVERA